ICIHYYLPSIQSQIIPMQVFSTAGLRSELIAAPEWAKSSFAVGLLKCIVEWVWRPWRAWTQQQVEPYRRRCTCLYSTSCVVFGGFWRDAWGGWGGQVLTSVTGLSCRSKRDSS